MSVMKKGVGQEEDRDMQLRVALARVAELERQIEEKSGNAVVFEAASGAKAILKNSASEDKAKLFFDAYNIK